MENFIDNNTAILVIDIQEEFMNRIYNRDDFIQRQVDFLSSNKGLFQVGIELLSEDYISSIVPSVKSRILENNGIIMPKYRTSAFCEEPFPYYVVKGYDDKWYEKSSVPRLDSILKERNIEKLVLTGCNTSWCVLETAKDAKKLGYKIATSMNLITEPPYYIDKHGLNVLEKSLEWYRDNCELFEEIPMKI